MQSINSFKSKLFQINNQNFDEAALKLFHYQYRNNLVYKAYVDCLDIKTELIDEVAKIPFLPIRFFKSHKVVTGNFTPKKNFESSGTTKQNTSRHYVEDLDFYHQVSSKIFSDFFGEIKESVILGLLPSYLERQNSSLVSMVDYFIRKSENIASGFYLNEHQKLIDQLEKLKGDTRPVYLFGVTFALLEIAGKYQIEMNNLVVLETGGMKGRGREMVREELHNLLRTAFRVKRISSEYGMTELLSQAYLDENGYFQCPSWMKISMRDINDPFSYVRDGKTGAINVIDLANIHSCAFVETEDLGVKLSDGFRVLGRLDNSDMRGCNLLVS